jgi:predicted dehydrogenase
MAESMRVLFCGLGGIGQRHLRNLRSLVRPEQLEVHAYRVLGRSEKLRDDLSVESDRSIVADYQIVVHADLEQALATHPQCVFICNPSSLHTRIALEALKVGAHVFIEKPVSNTLEDVDELLSIVKAKQLVCYVGYNFRFHPGLMRMKVLLEHGHFGNVLAVQSEIGEYLPNWHRYEDYRTMYASRADLGGGVILSQIHEMDLIYWYFGQPESIYCLGGKLSDLEIDVEDTATSLMQYSGAVGRFPITLHQDYVQRPPVRTFKIIGDRSVALIDLIKNELTVYNAEGEAEERWEGFGFKRNDMFRAQMEHFLACVAGQATPLVSLEDGIQSMRLALAAKESLTRQSVVYLNRGPVA